MDRFMCYSFIRKFDSREQERSTGVKQRRGELLCGFVVNWLLPSVTNYLTSQNSPLKSCVNDILATFIQRELGKNLPMNSTSYWSRFHPLGALTSLHFWVASVQVPGRVLRCSMLRCQQDTLRQELCGRDGRQDTIGLCLREVRRSHVNLDASVVDETRER